MDSRQGLFYTGIPDRPDDTFWNKFWTGKLGVMGRQGVRVFSRPLRYQNRVVQLPNGSKHSFLAGEEKGVDARIALDTIRLARNKECVAVSRQATQDLGALVCPPITDI